MIPPTDGAADGRAEVCPLTIIAVAEDGIGYVVPEMVTAGPPGVRVWDAMTMGVVIAEGGEDGEGSEEVWPLTMMAVAELGTEYVIPEIVAAGPPGVRVCDAMTMGGVVVSGGVVGSPGSTTDVAGSAGATLGGADAGTVVGSLFTGFWDGLVVGSDGGIFVTGSCVLVAGSTAAGVLVAGSTTTWLVGSAITGFDGVVIGSAVIVVVALATGVVGVFAGCAFVVVTGLTGAVTTGSWSALPGVRVYGGS